MDIEYSILDANYPNTGLFRSVQNLWELKKLKFTKEYFVNFG